MSFPYRALRALGWVGSPPPPAPESGERPKVRMGILGAANIAPIALVVPAKLSGDVEVVAVAARDGKRAEAFARKHGIARHFGSYEALLADPDVDAVYVPSPNGLHFRWAVRALEAGKHVLCEKPITSNADEAEQLVEAAVKSGKVLMEAAHSFHHPALIRAREIVRSGELGELESASTAFKIPFIKSSDVRFDVNGTERKLAGGAFMDTGVYAAHCIRFLTDLDFESCTSAKAKERFPGVDELMEAEITFVNSKVKGKVASSLSLPFPYKVESHAEIVGSNGSLYLFNFVAPMVYHSITIKKKDGTKRTEKVYGPNGRSSYEFQLDEFIRRVREQSEGGPAKTQAGRTVDDFVGTMKMIDAIYERSGLGKRVGHEL